MIEAAAALGFPTAVGHCCCLGWGGRAQDFDKAFELFSAAAEKGYPRAEVRVGYCYFYGHGVDVDPSKALELYNQAAEKGNSFALYNLAFVYEYGRCGLSVDLSEARRYYRMAADKGNAHAIEALARLNRSTAS